MDRRTIILLISVAALICCSAAMGAEGPGRIRLDADRVSFEDGAGMAKAEGNVRIYNDEMKLYAPYVEYDSAENSVRALSSPEGGVTFVTPQGRLSGERLDYSFAQKRGVLTHPSGKSDVFYVRGEKLEIQPLSEVPNFRRRAAKSEDGSDDRIAADWYKASVSTCDRPEQHYRIEAQSVTVYEGDSIIVKHPKVFLGNTPVMAYPFDYYISLKNQDRRHRQMFFPKAGYESKKGAGLGVVGSYGWGSGSASLEATAWTKGIWEGALNVEQDITDNLSVFFDLQRAFDKDRHETKWRPAWGARFESGGWKSEVRWAQRELVTLEKSAGTDSRYIVWSEPEINVMTPWWGSSTTGGKFRLLGSWGRYQDATYGASPWINRAGIGAQLAGEFPSRRERGVTPFYNAVYWYYNYDDDDSREQKVLDTVAGIRWYLGNFDMETAYLRRWSWGKSPMYWDSYDKREDIYQSVKLRLPTKDKDVSWVLGVRAAYDLYRSDLAEMVYSVAYDMHCMLWEAVYRDDWRNEDNWFGLKLTIKAFPESGVRLRGGDLFEPSKAPNSMVPLEVESMKN